MITPTYVHRDDEETLYFVNVSAHRHDGMDRVLIYRLVTDNNRFREYSLPFCACTAANPTILRF